MGVVGLPPRGYGDGSYGSYIEITPDGNGREREIYRFGNPGQQNNDWHRQSYPAVLCNSDCTLFAMALPRAKEGTAGFHYHLIDRSGNKWPFAPDDTSHFISPYLPIAFTHNDRTLVARDGSQLFSVPVEAIQANKESTDE